MAKQPGTPQPKPVPTKAESLPLPEYAAAVERENNIRNASFLNLDGSICGCPVKQITLWHWIILDGIDSPFVNGFIKEPPSLESVLLFLWIVSKEFWFWNRIGFKNGNSAFMQFRKRRFIRKWQKLQYGEAVVSIIKLIRDTFQDSLPWEDEKKIHRAVPYYSYAASIIHSLASRYGWSEETILLMPLKRSHQYQKIIDRVMQIERGERPISFNYSDKIKRLELERVRAERASAEHNKMHPGQQVSGND